MVVFQCFADVMGAHVYMTKSYRPIPIKSYSQHSKSVSPQTLHDDRATKEISAMCGGGPRSPLRKEQPKIYNKKSKIFPKIFEKMAKKNFIFKNKA